MVAARCCRTVHATRNYIRTINFHYIFYKWKSVFLIFLWKKRFKSQLNLSVFRLSMPVIATKNFYNLSSKASALYLEFPAVRYFPDRFFVDSKHQRSFFFIQFIQQYFYDVHSNALSLTISAEEVVKSLVQGAKYSFVFGEPTTTQNMFDRALRI